MNTESLTRFVQHLQAEGIRLELAGDNLRLNAPANRLTTELRTEIRRRKPELIALLRKLSDSHGSQIAKSTIPKADRSTRLPLSFSQQRLYFMQHFAPNDASYNLPSAFRLRGQLNLQALQQAVWLLEARHEILRTRFLEEASQPYQDVMPSQRVPIETIDFRHFDSEQAAEEAARAFAEARFDETFDLSEVPLYRMWLLTLTDSHFLLLVSMHHIIADAWSMNLMMGELVAHYGRLVEQTEGTIVPMEPPATQYADFAVWQRAHLQDSAYARQCDYWRGQLEKAPPLLNLPVDFPRPANLTFHGALHRFEIPSATVKKLKDLALSQQASPSMVIQAVFALLMARISGQRDVCVGHSIANRNHPDLEELFGFFVNTLVLRTRLKEDHCFLTLLDDVRRTALAAYAHQDVPFDQVVEQVAPIRSASYTPLFQVVCDVQNARVTYPNLPDLTLEAVDWSHHTAKFDLSFDFEEHQDTFQVLIEYRTDLFLEATIRRLGIHYLQLLESCLAQPDANVWSRPYLESETLQPCNLNLTNRQVEQAPIPQTLLSRLRKVTAQQGDRLAVVHDQRTMTFTELTHLAEELTQRLVDLGFGCEDRIAVWLDRDLHTMAALFGVLSAGCAWLAWNPEASPSDQEEFLSHAQAKAVLCQRTNLDRLRLVLKNLEPDQIPNILVLEDLCGQRTEQSSASIWEQAPSSQQAAWLSWVDPNRPSQGWMVHSHQNLDRLISEAAGTFGLAPGVRVGQNVPLTDQQVLWQILAAPLHGATVVMLEDARRISPSAVLEAQDRMPCQVLAISAPTASTLHGQAAVQAATNLYAVAHWVLLADQAWSESAPGVGSLSLPGEFWTSHDTGFGQLYSRRITDHSTEIPDSTEVVSRDNQAWILDHLSQLQPWGTIGRLHLAGSALARGYLSQPSKTAERFLPHPTSKQPGARILKTDLWSKVSATGSLVLLGDTARRVTLNGQTFFLDGIEGTIGADKLVAWASVTIQSTNSDRRLVTHLGWHDSVPDHERSLPALQQRIRSVLPDVCIPDLWLVCDSWPHDNAGHFNRDGLPPIHTNSASDKPRTPTESVLVDLFAEVLNRGHVGVDENFFQVGGHSLLAARLLSRVQRQFGYEVGLARFFEHPTIAGLADILDILAWSDSTPNTTDDSEIAEHEVGFL